jgi:hypothetical protein
LECNCLIGIEDRAASSDSRHPGIDATRLWGSSPTRFLHRSYKIPNRFLGSPNSHLHISDVASDGLEFRGRTIILRRGYGRIPQPGCLNLDDPFIHLLHAIFVGRINEPATEDDGGCIEGGYGIFQNEAHDRMSRPASFIELSSDFAHFTSSLIDRAGQRSVALPTEAEGDRGAKAARRQ